MKLKRNDLGHPVLTADDLPLYLQDDGSELAVDPVAMQATISQLSARVGELNAALSAYGEIEPAAAHDALRKLEDLANKSLIDAGEAEQVRRHIEEQYTSRLQQRDETIAQRDSQIHDLLIKSAFDTSDFLREQTLLLPEMAYVYFGQNFHVEERNGRPVPIARVDGQPIMSPSRPGDYANPEEALQQIIQRHPHRDRMLKAGHPGGGGAGGGAASLHPEDSRPWSQMDVEEQARFIDQHGMQAARQLIDADTRG